MINKYLKLSLIVFGLTLGWLAIGVPNAVLNAQQPTGIGTGDAECGDANSQPKGTLLLCDGGKYVISGCENPKTPPPYTKGQKVECGDGTNTTVANEGQDSQGKIKAPDSELSGDTSCAVGTNNSSDQCVIFKEYLIPLINALVAAVGIVVTIMIVSGGIQYSASGGDPQAVAAAKGRIMNAVFSLLAFGLLWSFLQWVVPGGLF